MNETRPIVRAAAATVAGVMLTAGLACPASAQDPVPAPTVTAGQAGQPGTTGTPAERLATAIARGEAAERTQDAAGGRAWTADSYARVKDALDAARALDPATADAQAMDTAARTLDDACDALVVASWSVNGTPLTVRDGALTADLGRLAVRPDGLVASGSDGSEVTLTLTGVHETHPSLGVTEGTGTLSREASGTRPAISIPASWSIGAEATVLGQRFTLKDGVWTAHVDTTLDGDNRPAVDSIDVADQTVALEWGEPAATDGTVTRTADTGERQLDGQTWRVTLTASRTPDRTTLDRAVQDARARLDDPSHDWTAASRQDLEAALTDARNLDATATDGEVADMANRVSKASAALTDVTWSVTILGTRYGLDYADGAYTLHTDASEQPEDRVKAVSNDPTLGEIEMTRTGETRHDTDGAFGVDQVSGDYEYRSRDGDPRTLKVTVAYRQTVGEAIQLPGGAKATLRDGVWTADLPTSLDGTGAPRLTWIELEGKRHDIAYGPAHGANQGSLVRDGLLEGTLSNGQRYSIRVTASTRLDKTQLARAVDTARAAETPGQWHWTADSWQRHDRAAKAAESVLADDAATPDAIAVAVGNLSLTTLSPVTWKAGDTTLAWNPGDDSYRAGIETRLDREPDASVTVSGNDPDYPGYELKRTDTVADAVRTDLTLGRVRLEGTAVWRADTTNGKRPAVLTRPYSYEAGTPVDVKAPDGTTLEWTADDTGLHAAATASLDAEDAPSFDAFDVAGRKAKVTWDDEVKRVATDTTVTYARTGRAEGDLAVAGVVQHWSVDLTATRTEGRVAALTVIARSAQGVAEHAVPGFDETGTDYEITLPASAANDQITLGYRSAAGDQAAVTQGEAIPAALGPDASRILKVRLNGRTYTVTVRFDSPAPVVGNVGARLEGIYVNYDGKAEKGGLIDGWNPDVLEYTVGIAADAKGVYVLPVAPAGTTVTALDRVDTAWSSSQSWKVTGANGDTRTYTVRVVRDHAGRPTADEAFVPPAYADADGVTPAPDRASTVLASHGYTLDGRYVPVDADTYEIPEGGAFAYASHAGQTVQVSEQRQAGMTWRYGVGVLSPDGSTYASRTYTVTYLTEATHRASVTGIQVDNRPIDGFDPARHEYAVQVDNLDHWTVSAQFDRMSGMGVSVHKERDRATVTAVSADGLVRETYTLTVSQRTPDANGGTDGATLGQGRLASTGASAGGPLAALAAFLTGGLALSAWRGIDRRSRRIRQH